MKPQDIIAAYDRLIERAVAVASGAPYWTTGPASHRARLHIEGTTARLCWSCGGVVTASVEFPAKLLRLREPAFEAWQGRQRSAAQAQRNGLAQP